MNDRHPHTLNHADWLWLGSIKPGKAQVRLFRKTFVWSATTPTAKLLVAGDFRYHLWVNGRYLTRGPVPHHTHRVPVQHVQIDNLRVGQNIIAALVYTPNAATHAGIASQQPGLALELYPSDPDNTQPHVYTDETWRVTDQTGWQNDVPRRNWALGHVEVVDARQSPHGWQDIDYDDTHWSNAEACASPVDAMDGRWIAPDLPGLRFGWQPVQAHTGAWRAASIPPQIDADAHTRPLGQCLSEEPWLPLAETTETRVVSGIEPGCYVIDGLDPDNGIAVCFEWDAEYVGQLMFHVMCDSPGTIDIGWSEQCIDGRPATYLKHTSYADRLHARAGGQQWEPIGYSAARYLVLVLRGFSRRVTITGLGVRTSESGLNWATCVESDDAELKRIAELCLRTLRVGTQECLIDCPTREQAPYLGDSHLAGRWIGELTGDYRHWRYILAEAFERQSPEGLLRDAPFTGVTHALIDYTLLTVCAVRDYLVCTGDKQLVTDVIAGCRRAFDWFDTRMNNNHLVQTDWAGIDRGATWEYPAQAGSAPSLATNLFIDHVGLGGHNIGEPGIDRRGINAAINAAYIRARYALAELESTLGNKGLSEISQKLAEHTCSAARAAFFNHQLGVFVDGVLDGQPLAQISEQTNTWCVMAGMCDQPSGREMMQNLLTSQDPHIVRCGPYFLSYTLPLLDELGLSDLAVEVIRERWGRMTQADASCTWETFAGDELDSRCHPWSAAPLAYLLRHRLVTLSSPGHYGK